MKNTTIILISLAMSLTARAGLKLPAIFGDHMVLQQKQANPIWGWDAAGTEITVTFANQKKTAHAGEDGRWTLKLDPLPASGQPQAITVTGTSTRQIKDVLVGEVWMCSGQSNMGFTLQQDWNGDLEASASSHLTDLRLIKVPNVGTQELQDDFKGGWQPATNTEACRSFSAVGFFYGRYLQQILGVPVGLIDNSWGGSSAEAWVRRETLEKEPRFKNLMDGAAKNEARMQGVEGRRIYQEQLAKWEAQTASMKKAGLKPGEQLPRKPQSPEAWLRGNARPGNIFAGVVNPTLGFGIKGVIWYQGESNASRAYDYVDLFPFLIEQWRREWKQGDFPFYWVQLADFQPEKPEPGESNWAELREAQTKTMKLPRTGQAVIIDLGEGDNIHPRNKHDVAARLVRWALANDYGMKVPYHSPEFKSLEIRGNKAIVTFDMFGSKLRPFDVREARGFAVCGEDKAWHWAKGTVTADNQVELVSDQVANPVAVRYAWADNPVCNLTSEEGLPVTPFRTDSFEMTTKPKPAPAPAAVPAR